PRSTLFPYTTLFRSSVKVLLIGFPRPPAERKNPPGRACRACRRIEAHRDRDESRPRKSALHSREAPIRQRLRPIAARRRTLPVFAPQSGHEIAARVAAP